MPLLRQAIWGHILKRTMEKSQTNATNVTLHAFENKQWRKFKQMSGEQMFYNQQPSQASNLLRHPYLGANYTKLLWGRDLIVGKITQFSRPFSLLVTDMDPIHNKPLRSFMCGINHLHMNSTQIKDQIFLILFIFVLKATLHTFISILLDLSHLILQGWNYLVDRESHSKFTRMRSDANWFVRAFIRIMS